MKTVSTLKLLLVGASCAVIAACSDTSISSPGGNQQVPPPTSGGGGGGAQTFNLLPAGGCATGTAATTVAVPGSSTQVTACALTGNYTQDVTLTSDGVYFLNGGVFIGEDAGSDVANPNPNASTATLTIPAGATIAGSGGGDYLVIARGSRIEADGTDAAPIVFTSLQDIAATESGNPRDGDDTARGEWGGVIVNGRAPINVCLDGTATPGTVSCETEGEGSSGRFGGDNTADDSGTIRYARIQYAGFEVTPDNELNGLALQGVGDGTTLEFIQIHNNFDDGIEFFGGTVDIRNLVLTGNRDDSFDYTDGWQGDAQFIVVSQRGDAGSGDPRGFELDNRSGDPDRTPRSNPSISNFTAVGAADVSGGVNSDDGMLIRRGSAGDFWNGIVVNFGSSCLDVDDAETAALIGTELTMRSVLLDCDGDELDSDGDTFEAALFGTDPNNTIADNTLAGFFPGPVELAVPAADPTALGAFFTSANYIGAFGPNESAASSWATGWTFGFLPDPGCPTGTTEQPQTIGGQRVCQLTGNITTDVRLTRGNLYELVGPVFVGVDRGADPANPLPSGIEASLTVDPGVTVFGSTGGDYIVVTRGSQIFSNGTEAAPVIFTSRDDVEGQNTLGSERGQWGGVVVNGRAQTNVCLDGTATPGTVDCETEGEGSSGRYGGGTNTDDSGAIRYTRIQFAGFEVTPDNELNGLALQGVGNGTELEYIQIHNNFDDGIEFFGGTANIRYLVLTGNRDDSFDFTDGWQGAAQFVIIQQSGDAGSGDPRGFELDNRSGDPNRTPRSTANISNFTAIGVRGSANSDDGMLIRRGTAGNFVNGIIADFNASCLDIDDAETFALFPTDLSIDSVLIDCPNPLDTDADTFEAAVFGADPNNVSTTSTLSGFSFIPNALIASNNATGVIPGANEQAVTAVDPTTIDPFFVAAPYIGAVEDANDDWFLGWTYVQQP
ncbi:MAG: hypothetical protein ABL308_02180 [Oceanicaulis sp.]